MGMKRQPTVAFGNGRLVNMINHDDCVEVRSRYSFGGVAQQVVALLYREDEAIIMLKSVTDEDGSHAEAWDADAFIDERTATAAAIRFAMFGTRTGQG